MTSSAAALAAGVAAWLVVRPAPVAPAPARALTSRRRPDELPVAAIAGGLLGAALLGGVGAVAGAAAGIAGARAWRRRHRDRAAAAIRRALPDVLRLLAAQLQAGIPPHLALASSAGGAPPALARHLAEVSSGARLGLDPASSLWPGPPGAEGLRALAACWQVSGSTGSSLGVGVARLAAGLAAEDRCRAEVDAQLAGPRASAAVLATLPLVAIAMAGGLGAAPLDFFRTPTGSGCLVAGLVLDAAGLHWTRRLAASAAP